MKLTPADQRQLEDRGISADAVVRQAQWLAEGFPPVDLIRPATLDDGIRELGDDQTAELDAAYRRAKAAGRLMKFVPASGAATRMFAPLLAALHQRTAAADPSVAAFLNDLESFPFAAALADAMGIPVDQLAPSAKADPHRILAMVLESDGLGLAALPKGLVPFHHADPEPRTAFAEQLAEAVELTTDADATARIHFTVPSAARDRIQEHLADVAASFAPTQLRIDLSVQEPSTDTIALDDQGQLVREADGSLHFRPGGHGALLTNLAQSDGDIVLIKNIDNVNPSSRRDDTLTWKRRLVGLLVQLQDRASELAIELRSEPSSLATVEEFLHQELSRPRPDGLQDDQRRDRALDLLARPLRVCGMVKNTGEPGGGPFWIQTEDGPSLQVVEFAQVDAERPEQLEIVQRATHFSPVDFVCGLRDSQGAPYPLANYVDPETGFISHKTKDGVALRALEWPGLWNGSMAGWNTVLVEVPASTFTPVKTVMDLLRPEHRDA